ncbi:MAG TPA: protein kinase, partial [Pirellulales bacterium]
MTERPIPDSPPPSSPAGATPPVDFDETLGRAIDAGQLDPALAAADLTLAGAFAAHQKLESLFAALRGDNDPLSLRVRADADPLSLRERVRVRADDDPLSLRERARVRADSTDDAPPAQLGRYQIRSTLGAGAFGTVYLAHDPELNREVAVKVSSLSLPKSTKAAEIEKRAEAIAAEARNAASLNHPGIVTIYDVGREGERLYIVMEY